MTLLIIQGDPSGETLREVQQIVGITRLYRQGTDHRLFARYASRADAETAMKRLNELEGVWASAQIQP